MGIVPFILLTIDLTLETLSSNFFEISQVSMISSRDMETIVAVEVMLGYIVGLNWLIIFCFTLEISLMLVFNKILSRL